MAQAPSPLFTADPFNKCSTWGKKNVIESTKSEIAAVTLLNFRDEKREGVSSKEVYRVLLFSRYHVLGTSYTHENEDCTVRFTHLGYFRYLFPFLSTHTIFILFLSHFHSVSVLILKIVSMIPSSFAIKDLSAIFRKNGIQGKYLIRGNGYYER